MTRKSRNETTYQQLVKAPVADVEAQRDGQKVNNGLDLVDVGRAVGRIGQADAATATVKGEQRPVVARRPLEEDEDQIGCRTQHPGLLDLCPALPVVVGHGPDRDELHGGQEEKRRHQSLDAGVGALLVGSETIEG